MKKAESGEISLLFLDASHFVMGCDFLGHIYGRVRRYVRTFSGRKRYNVLGALDYVSKKMLVVANDSYITASEVCDMLRKVKTEYGRKKVYIVLDNARYQKCRIVQELARELDIQLILKSFVTVSMGFIALFVGMAVKSSKATIITSFLLIFLTQANIGDFTMSGDTIFPIILTIISFILAIVSIYNAENTDLL